MFVYILQCNDDSYYTGVTSDIERRIWEHSNPIDFNSYVSKRLPFELVYCAEFYGDPKQAIAFEKQVKGWTRAKKEALIKSDWDEISKLAKRRT